MSADLLAPQETAASDPPPPTSAVRTVGIVVGTAAAAAVTGAGAGLAWTTLTGADMSAWATARATGLVSYLLLTGVTLLGLALSHPARSGWTWPRPIIRLRLHTVLAVFTLALIALHVVVLALDPWAEVGWAGALLPMGSQYRPVAVTLGLLSLWAGLIAGLSAGLAPRLGWRLWRPLHRLAGAAWLLAWVHGVLAGSDTAAWLWLYVISGVAVLVLAAWRYASAAARPHTRESR